MKKPFILFLSIILAAASITVWCENPPDSTTVLGDIDSPDSKDDPKPTSINEGKTDNSDSEGPLSIGYVCGVKIFKRFTHDDGTELHLNGVGAQVKSKLKWWKFVPYIMELYVPSRYTDPDINKNARDIANNDEKFAMRFRIIHDFSSRKNFLKHLTEGFDKAENKDMIADEITQFKKGFYELGSFYPDLIYYIYYDPAIGTQLYEEGIAAPWVTINTNKREFKKALVNIWLSEDNPLDPGLKKDLLTYRDPRSGKF